VDVALQGLPVRLLGAGGGMVYAPLGPTHQAIDDFALMRAIPGMSVIAPADPLEMRAMLTLLLENLTPAYIRIAKGGEPDITSSLPDLVFGKMRPVRRGEDLAIVTTGALLHECVTAVDRLRGDGIKVSLAHFPFVAPLDDEGLLLLAREHSEILVVEEHLPHGGLATAIRDTLSHHNVHTRVHRSSLPNAYADRYGSQSEHLQLHSLDSAGVEAKVRGIRDSYNK
jgi:transketolase